MLGFDWTSHSSLPFAVLAHAFLQDSLILYSLILDTSFLLALAPRKRCIEISIIDSYFSCFCMLFCVFSTQISNFFVTLKYFCSVTLNTNLTLYNILGGLNYYKLALNTCKIMDLLCNYMLF